MTWIQIVLVIGIVVLAVGGAWVCLDHRRETKRLDGGGIPR